MRAPALRLYPDEIIVDSFAGGGGASLGIEWALGRSPDVAINHDAEAIAMHQVNHPGTRHFCEDVWAVDPLVATAGKPVGLMWASPDCKHFSKAKGGKPVDKKIRGLAWVVVKWAKALGARKPRVIILENVEEFVDWGPILEDGKPCPVRRGLTFRRFVKQLQNLGYEVDWQELTAAVYGAATSRKRLFLIARCDGAPIVWPEETDDFRVEGRRVAADCIDWSLPCPSIFERSKPLAENTQRRIARGIDKFVINSPEPFIVPVMHGPEARAWSVDEPMRTITGASRGDRALVTPVIARIGHTGHGVQKGRRVDAPLSTVTSKAEHLLVSPTLIQTGYGEREGQAPRVPGLHKPLGTVVNGQKHALVAAFLAKHNAGHEATGQDLVDLMHTVTGRDTKALTTSHLVKLKGTCQHGQRVDAPMPTVQAGGWHIGDVRAFLIKFYSEGGQWSALNKPMGTVTVKDRMGLVTVHGEDYVIADIGMRMLVSRELFRAQGFPDSYIIERDASGKPFTATAQVRMCGNSVCPPIAAAIARANLGAVREAVAA